MVASFFLLVPYGLVLLWAVVLLVLTAFLLLECVAAWWSSNSVADFAIAFATDLPVDSVAGSAGLGRSNTLGHRQPRPLSPRPSVAVLVPAHNEASGIEQTLIQMIPQLNSTDRLVVVADNCSDATAAIARQLGETQASTQILVLERHSETERGKGYALDYGLRALAQSPQPPDVVIMVDADCWVQPQALGLLAAMAWRTQQPVQSAYTLTLPPGITTETASLKDQVTRFAMQVKNRVRLQGLAQLHLPVLLTGTGMAFPWSVLQKVDLASGHLVEDMKLGLDLLLAGYKPQFCGAAQVTSALPACQAAAHSQRTRWEHGRLTLMRDYLPRLVVAAIAQRRLGPLVLALDLCVLPLSLLTVMVFGVWSLALVLAWVWGLREALAIASLALGFLVLATGLSWSRFGRQDLPARQLCQIPLFILWKLPIYLQFLIRPQRQWIRTGRDGGTELDQQAPQDGLEPSTDCLEGSCSIR